MQPQRTIGELKRHSAWPFVIQAVRVVLNGKVPTGQECGTFVSVVLPQIQLGSWNAAGSEI